MIQTTTWMNSKCMTLRERSQTQKVTYYMILFTKWEKQNSAAAAAESLQSCPTLCDPIDSSPPGSSVPGVLQARVLERVAISVSNAWKVKVKLLHHVRLLATPWTVAHQAPLSMRFSRQEYWSGLYVTVILTLWKSLNFFAFFVSYKYYSQQCVVYYCII